MQSKYKYRTNFSSEIIASSEFKKSKISKASLDTLSSLVPQDIDLNANVDLLAVAFNAAVVNRFNKNHDGINTDTAKAVSEYFINKPTNIEHKKEKVVGHIVSSGFSEYNTNKMIEASSIEGLNPFNIALGAVVYKTVNPSFAKLLEQSADKNNPMYKKVSASWEIGFNDYLIAVGSKNLNEAEIISDEKHIDEIKNFLKAFGGEGKMKDGTEVYRLVSGDVYPLGIGFTANPAADVEGVYLETDKKKEETDMEEHRNQEEEGLVNSAADVEKIVIDTELFLKKIKKYKKNLSHIEKIDVISDKAKNQTLTIMENKDIIQELKETIEANASGKFSEESVANIAKVVSDAIKERSDSFSKEKAELEAAKEEVSKAKEEADKKLEELQLQFAETQEKLQKIEAEQAQALSLQIFNNRMESIDEAYELSDEDRKIIASDLKAIDNTDEAFASYQERLSVIYKHKSKDYLAQQEKVFAEKLEEEVAKKISEASQKQNTELDKVSEEDVEEALDNAEASSEEITSNNGQSTEEEVSLREKFQQAFNKDSLTIKY